MNQVIEFFSNLFSHSAFPSPLKTGKWSAFQTALYVIADLLIWAAYFVIPFILFISVRKQGKRINFNGIYILFAAFILFTGFVFLIDAFVLWIPVFRLSGFFRLIVAILSWIAIFYLVKVLPHAFALRSPVELQEEVERRTEVENALKKKNDSLLEAERTAKLGHGSWDIFRKHVQLSDMAYRILDLPEGSLLSYEKLAAQIHPGDLRFVEDSIQKNLRADVFQQFYFRVLTDRMIVKHVLVKGEVVRNTNGQATMVKGTIQDVTEIRKYIQRIEQQNKRLKKIAWVQSHRMRSPVATILGLADLFNHEDPADPMNQEILSNVKELCLKLDEMIREVDQLTRSRQ